VLDLKNRKLLGTAQVGSLPPKVANQFKANNSQSQLVNGWIYIMGGYGPDLKKGALSTLSYVTVVNFDALADAVINKKPPSGSAIAVIATKSMATCCSHTQFVFG
jgi:hypothetical protein